jgi:hypothetical protein
VSVCKKFSRSPVRAGGRFICGSGFSSRAWRVPSAALCPDVLPEAVAMSCRYRSLRLGAPLLTVAKPGTCCCNAPGRSRRHHTSTNGFALPRAVQGARIACRSEEIRPPRLFCWPLVQLDGRVEKAMMCFMAEPSSWIAIVDDDSAVLKGLSRLLRCRSFLVQTFQSAREFLAALRDGPPV